jgi:toxin HigB-1
LEITFQDKHLREICENAEQALAQYAQETVSFLIKRLADIRAASVMTEIPMGNPRVDPPRSDRLVIDLCANFRIIAIAIHKPSNPVSESGAVDWLRVTRIKIMGIEAS